MIMGVGVLSMCDTPQLCLDGTEVVCGMCDRCRLDQASMRRAQFRAFAVRFSKKSSRKELSHV